MFVKELEEILCAIGFNLSIKSTVSLSVEVEKISKFNFFENLKKLF